MMRIAAVSIGYGAPVGDFDGTVEAAYVRACMLSTKGHGLLTLTTPTMGRLPRGFVVDVSSDFSFASSVATGAIVAARSGILRFRDTDLAVDLRSTPLWRSALRALCIDGSNAAVALARTAAIATLRRDGRSDSFTRLAGAALVSFDAAVRALDAPSAERAMKGLIGLGEGLTPAGDDYLVGYFAGLWACSGLDQSRLNFMTVLSEQLKRNAVNTGDVSRIYLEAAADGEVSERLFDLSSSVATPSDDAAVSRAVAAALDVGHSSGACGVEGFLRASACWGGDPRRGSSR
jgi:Protein of unknown function (DUF2877)